MLLDSFKLLHAKINYILWLNFVQKEHSKLKDLIIKNKSLSESVAVTYLKQILNGFKVKYYIYFRLYIKILLFIEILKVKILCCKKINVK